MNNDQFRRMVSMLIIYCYYCIIACGLPNKLFAAPPATCRATTAVILALLVVVEIYLLSLYSSSRDYSY